MTLTPQLVKTALTTAHDDCHPQDGVCVHAFAVSSDEATFQEFVSQTISLSNDPLVLAVHFLHVGYKLAQLETQQALKEAITEANNIAKNNQKKLAVIDGGKAKVKK